MDIREKSSNVAKGGLVTGVIGTALGAINSLSNGASLFNNVESNCNEDHIVDRYDLQQAEKLQRLENELTLARAKDSEKDNNLVLYKYVVDNFEKVREELCNQKVENQKVADSFAMTRDRMDFMRQDFEKALEYEAKDRKCADDILVTYMNATFYPKRVADVAIEKTSTSQTVYNPLPCDSCRR